MELLIIRHALPVTIVEAEGPADPPLTAKGHTQAAAVTEWLRDERIDALYVSPMQRARQTAHPIALQRAQDPVVRAGLAEFDQHAAEYIPLEVLRETNYELWRERMREGTFGDMDPLAFRRTVVETIEAIIAGNPGGRVAIVCHGGVINAWASHVLKMADVFFCQPGYTSINRFAAARSGERTVMSLNETAHLRGI